jgi:hypothetical protein
MKSEAGAAPDPAGGLMWPDLEAKLIAPDELRLPDLNRLRSSWPKVWKRAKAKQLRRWL